MSVSPLFRPALIALALLAALPARADDITVFAAASLKTALDRIVATQTATSGDKIVVSYAGSSKLAQQIKEGAPADIFISASTDWMDDLAKADEIDAASRVDLLGNRLVLVSAKADAPKVELNDRTDLAGMLDGGKLAMAMVESVPAGVYGKQALTRLGLWASVEPHVAQAENVRAALTLVAAGEAPLGVVYATDAHAEPKVSVVATFPEDSHDPITYPAAITKHGAGKAPVAAFFQTLQGSDAAAVFKSEGFEVRTQ